MQNKGIGIVLVIFLIPLLIFTFLFISFRLTLNNPNFYKSQLKQADFYRNIAEQVAPTMMTLEEGSAINKDQIKQIFSNFDQNWLKGETEKLIDGFFKYLSNKTATIEVNLNLQPLKDKIKVNSKEVLSKKGTNISESQLNEALKGIPDFYDFAAQINKNPSAFQSLLKARSSWKFINGLGWIILAISAILWLVLILLARKSLSAILRWPALAIFIPAVCALLLGLVVKAFIASSIAPFLGGTSDQLSNLVMVLTKTLTSAFFNELFLLSAIIGGISLVLVIVSYLIPGKTKEAAR